MDDETYLRVQMFSANLVCNCSSSEVPSLATFASSNFAEQTLLSLKLRILYNSSTIRKR